MVCNKKNIIPDLQINGKVYLLLFLLQLAGLFSFAQETKVAVIKLSFSQTDSTKTCKATVFSSDSLPVKEKEIHLYVKRMYSLLPIGKVVATDDKGEADINFPMDLPGDKNGMLTLVAKIEKDETYGNVETESAVKWGVSPMNESYNWTNRSLSASREKAPMFLVVASIVIIAGIWGTILYLLFQLYRIKRSGNIKKLIATAD